MESVLTVENHSLVHPHCALLDRYGHVNSEKINIMYIMQDLLFAVQNIMAGAASIAESCCGKDGGYSWKVSVGRGRPTVIVQYETEENDNLDLDLTQTNGMEHSMNCVEVQSVTNELEMPEEYEKKVAVETVEYCKSHEIGAIVNNNDMKIVVPIVDGSISADAALIDGNISVDVPTNDLANWAERKIPVESWVENDIASRAIKNEVLHVALSCDDMKKDECSQENDITICSNLDFPLTSITRKASAVTTSAGVGKRPRFRQHPSKRFRKEQFLSSVCKKILHPSGFNGKLAPEVKPPRPYACSFCGQKFALKHNLQTHERIHTGEKPFPCRYCPRKFNHASDRVTHERIHTGEKPYACRHCDKTFRSSSDRTKHERLHTAEDEFACDHCAVNCSSDADKKLHMKLHLSDLSSN